MNYPDLFSNKKYRPLVSVITIVFNDRTGFLVTARSLNKQTYENIEWIVVDGQSNDGTIEYIKNLSNAISKAIIEKDSGIYDAMNKGLMAAAGDWIIFMNADDVFYEAKTIEKYVNSIRPGDDFLYADAYDRDTGIIHNYKPIEYFWHGMFLDHQTVFGKATIYKEFGFDQSFKIAADYDLFARAYRQGCSFRKVPGLGGCVKPFQQGASSRYLDRQIERIRVIKANFSDKPYKSYLMKEYTLKRAEYMITDADFQQLLQELE